MLSIIGSVLGMVGKLVGFLMPYLAGKKAARADYAEESLKKSQENNILSSASQVLIVSGQ